MNKSDLVLTLGKRLLLMACIFIICFMLTSAAAFVLMKLLGGNPAAAMRIGTVVQDLLAFIIPAIVTALIVTRKPAELLCIRPAANPRIFLAVLVMAFASIPALESVIYWNYHWEFPESMAEFVAAARAMEDNAANMMRVMMQNTSVLSLIVNILIVGVLAGFSEEILFRGCFQRLLTTGGVNPHVAIWIVAVCFSAMHFQLFGFVPRIILGAYFGYLLLWTRSLWVPVVAHSLNNTLYVIAAWYQARTEGVDAVTEEPVMYSAWLIALSVIATIVILLLQKRLSSTPAK